MKAFERIKKRLAGDWWEVRKTIWPFPEGYGTYNPGKRMILDTGLTKERAQQICDQLNGVESAATQPSQEKQ